MRNSKKQNCLCWFRLIFLALVALGILACSGTRPKPQGKADVSSSVTKPILSGNRGDSAISLELELQKVESQSLPGKQASELYLLALDNFMQVGKGDERIPEILLWKANHLYNQANYDSAMAVYKQLIETHPKAGQISEAIQMVAQAYTQKGDALQAEQWYRKLLSMGKGDAMNEAKTRIAQSIYQQAQKNESEGTFEEASAAYLRVSTEFPTVTVAAAALYNAGIMKEKSKNWLDAIQIYGRFFDAFYESELLSKVLFREAKCWELQGRFEEAATRYLNLVKAHPRAAEAELALYNAGFAFESAKQMEPAAASFEKYALAFPDKPDAPNTLFRAAEMYSELKRWDKVSELQKLFIRKYSNDKTRVIQALVLGGMASYKQKKYDESEAMMRKAIIQYNQLVEKDPTSRYYTAQAQHTLGEIRFEYMQMVKLAGNATIFQRSLRFKTDQLKLAVGEYLKVLDYKVVDWAFRAAFSLGESFEAFGSDIYQGMDKGGNSVREILNKEEDATGNLGVSLQKSMEQYYQALSLAQQHNLSNQYVEAAKAKVAQIPYRVGLAYMHLVETIPEVLKADENNRERAIATRLEQIQRISPFQEQAIQFFKWLIEADKTLNLNAPQADSASSRVIQLAFDLGNNYLRLTDLARGAPIPTAFKANEVFFYKVKLLEEGVSDFEFKAVKQFLEAIKLAKKLEINNGTLLDTLKFSLGKALYYQARCYDLLAQQALLNPPIPEGLSEEQQEAYTIKFENVGFRLQDKAVKGYKQIFENTQQGHIGKRWGAMAFSRLYQIDPNKWASSIHSDTIVEVYSGPEWLSTASAPNETWAKQINSDWLPVKRGAMKNLPYASYVRKPNRFLWNGEEGQGTKVDNALIPYQPWPELWTQTGFKIPPNIKELRLEMVAPSEWQVFLNGDTVLSNDPSAEAWFNGKKIDLSKRISNLIRLQTSDSVVNVLSIHSRNLNLNSGFGIWICLQIRGETEKSVPKLPWDEKPLSKEELDELRETQPFIENFSLDKRMQTSSSERNSSP